MEEISFNQNNNNKTTTMLCMKNTQIKTTQMTNYIIKYLIIKTGEPATTNNAEIDNIIDINSVFVFFFNF